MGCTSSKSDPFHIPAPEGPKIMNKKAEPIDIADASYKINSTEKHIKLHAKHRGAVQGRFLELEGNYTAPDYPKSTADINFLDGALVGNFVFSDLDPYERKKLIKAFQKQVPKTGEIIMKQGDVGDFFYICEEGSIKFYVDGEDVGSCGPGDSFGELALLYDSPRAATCVATEACKLWKVDQTTFRHLIARSAKEEESGIVGVLESVEMFQGLDHATITKFASVLIKKKFAKGEAIVKKGDKGSVFYIIDDGQVKVHDIGFGDCSIEDKIFTRGYWFGERALMTGEPRAANVTAMTEVNTFAIDRETFESTIGSMEEILGHASKKRYVSHVPIFEKSELTPVEYDHLVNKLDERNYKTGVKLAVAGKSLDQSLWIVKEGKLSVTSANGKVSSVGSGGYYGDKGVGKKGTYVSDETCVCDEDTVCWVLKQDDIESVVGDVSRLGKPAAARVSKTRNSAITLADIKKHRILGMGAFGKVWLCSGKSDNTPYALKTISKRQIIDSNQVKGIIREKEIMASIDHPFILGLVGAFQDSTSLYILLPLLQGGELFNVVHTETSDGLSNKDSIFYAACILEALAHLHARNIVYRDMKPENAMIDSKGYCIMIDLGFAKVVTDKTYTLCGTPEYLAPEIIMSKGHDKAVDYWSFGVLVYEMLVGSSPFYTWGADQITLFKRIVMVKYSCPSTVNDDAKDLIKQLLCRRQASRIGNLSGGANDIKEHPWFKSMDWGKLNSFELKAPWIPTIKNPLDSSHFDDFSAEEKEKDTGRKLSNKEQKQFADF